MEVTTKQIFLIIATISIFLAIIIQFNLFGPLSIGVSVDTYGQSVGGTSVAPGSSVNMNSIITAYNSAIASSGLTIADLGQYSGCSMPVDHVEYYQQISGGQYYVNVFTSPTNVINDQFGVGTAYWTCPSGQEVRMQFSPTDCSADPSANPNPAYYTNYQTCAGNLGIAMYIPQADIQPIPTPTPVRTPTPTPTPTTTVTPSSPSNGSSCGSSSCSASPAPSSPTTPTPQPTPTMSSGATSSGFLGLTTSLWVMILALIGIVSAGLAILGVGE